MLTQRSTEVRVIRRAWVQQDTRQGLTATAIDPDTFDQAAVLEAQLFSEIPLREDPRPASTGSAGDPCWSCSSEAISGPSSISR